MHRTSWNNAYCKYLDGYLQTNRPTNRQTESLIEMLRSYKYTYLILKVSIDFPLSFQILFNKKCNSKIKFFLSLIEANFIIVKWLKSTENIEIFVCIDAYMFIYFWLKKMKKKVIFLPLLHTLGLTEIKPFFCSFLLIFLYNL